MFIGPEYAYNVRKRGLTYRLHSPAELIVQDQLGRRIGFNPTEGRYFNEIPQAIYEEIGLDDDETGQEGHRSKELIIDEPIDGSYFVEVIGTDQGEYTLEMRGYDDNYNDSDTAFINVPISKGEVHRYNFIYNINTIGTKTEVSGGYDGGGQRPKDVNKFLSYGNITNNHIILKDGETKFSLMVFYDQRIIQETFSAILNGVDISSQFTPIAGEYQIVRLTLKKGRNTLVLSTDGDISRRVATDTDRFTFIVP